MNYDEAREIPGKGWRWTTMNNGIVRTAEPCIRHVGDESDPMWYLKPSTEADWERCEPHATREEAEQHFYDWCLSTVTEIRLSGQMLRCVARLYRWDGQLAEDCCGSWTDTELGNRQLERMFNGDPLCDAHRDQETLALIRPFSPGLKVIHS